MMTGTQPPRFWSVTTLSLVLVAVLVGGGDAAYSSYNSNSSSSYNNNNNNASKTYTNNGGSYNGGYYRPTSQSSSYTMTTSTAIYPAYGANFFANQQESYDGYQQAWRYLGWYVDCGTPSSRYYNGNSHDSGENNNGYQGSHYCQRYLMWAAYVDSSYQGDGINEYAIYNSVKNAYNYTACSASGSRCALMDCHEPDTENWELLGVFKEASFFGNDAFFEQLFKHEGVCIWNDEDTYEFMSSARDGWISGCVATNQPNDSGEGYLYIDLKPSYNGNMTYALYTDYVCKEEYDGYNAAVDNVAANMGLLYGKYLQQWNDALEVYKVCQPCMAYNLQNANSDCYDDADYTNVNQCMKFRTHSELETATCEDLVSATNQGGILKIVVGGVEYGSDRISREQEYYVDELQRAQVQKNRDKETAKSKAENAALASAHAYKATGMMVQGFGFLAVAASLMWVVAKARGEKENPFMNEALCGPECAGTAELT